MTTEYFSAFPQIVYNGETIKNITIRLDFLNKIKNSTAIYQYYLLQTGQIPEDVAYAYYGDPNLYWIVLWMNDVVDPYHGWLLTDSQLNSYALQKYADIGATHHYEASTNDKVPVGTIVDQYFLFPKIAVSNLEYEQEQNELKRKIKILQPLYIDQVIGEYKSELAGT